jgi:hypothetical protein
MDGKFYTDITRDTFSKHRHFRRVLMQQGRVQLDADWNEQTDILLHYIRALAADILGPYAGPGNSFSITTHKDTKNNVIAYEFAVAEGHYYVDGILCENDHEQYVYSIPKSMQSKDSVLNFLLYLDIWEQEITYLEDDHIREVALGGPDTATRSEVIWRIKTLQFDDQQLRTIIDSGQCKAENVQPPIDWTCWLSKHFYFNHGFLRARAMDLDKAPTDPCITPPTSQFRGEENQLYRVEIHHGGEPWPAQTGGQSSSRQRRTSSSRAAKASAASGNYATFKWSRENGSVVFPITSAIDAGTIKGGSTLTVTVAGLGRDDSRFTLQQDDWVELVQFEESPEGATGPLLQVQTVDPIDLQVTLLTNQDITYDSGSPAAKQQLLRRWDQREDDPTAEGAIQLADDGAAMLIENTWLTLENGVQVLFHRDEQQGKKKDTDKGLEDMPPNYQPGDYWLIPARTATGDIEWPHGEHGPKALPPHGPHHRYAPLAYIVIPVIRTDPNITPLTHSIKTV